MKPTLGDNWLIAGTDLGIRVTAPFVLITTCGSSLLFEAAVHDFGSHKGMLLMERWDEAKAQAASEQGYGYSCMSGGAYERASTVEVLQDWGWSGVGTAPPWL